MTRKVLLACGIVSSVLYVITDILASVGYQGYSYRDQAYSELLATGSPVRPAMLIVAIVYNLLVAAFAVGVWLSVSPQRNHRRTSAMIIGYAALSLVTPLFFQMDMRGAETTPLGNLHAPMTGVMSLFILLSIGFGAFLVGRRFRLYSFATIIILIVFGALTAIQSPQLTTGQPTTWMGITERINIYSTMLWLAMLGIHLLRTQTVILPGKLENSENRSNPVSTTKLRRKA